MALQREQANIHEAALKKEKEQYTELKPGSEKDLDAKNIGLWTRF
jgi:hypothetical protein